jgi:phage gp36-like protein
MTYATLAQLQDRYGDTMIVQLTDRAVPAAGVVDTDVVDRALADTDAQVDGYLKGRYELPLATTPPLVTDLALAIAIYKLHRRDPEDKIRRDYDDALRSLRELANGTIRLDVAGVEPETSGSSDVQTNEKDRPLTNDSMKGFI